MAVSKEPNNQDLEALMKEGKEAFENDDLERANQLLHQALELDPENANLHVDLGNLFFTMKKIFKAREHYQKASELKPDSHRPWHGMGRIEKELGNVNQAIQYFEKVLSLEPETYVSLNSLGYCYLHLHEYEKAETYYLKAIKIRPKDFMAIYSLARFYSQTQRWDKAVEILNSFSKPGAKHRKEALIILVDSYIQLKKNQEALSLWSELFSKAINDEEKAEFLRIKGIIHSTQNDFENSSQCYSEATKFQPYRADYWTSLLWELAQIPDKKRVQLHGDKAKLLHPEESHLFFHLGAIDNYFDDVENAIVNMSKALEIDPKFVEAKVGLAFFYFKNKKTNEALELALETVEELPNLTNQRLSFYAKDLGESLKSIGKFDLGDQYIKCHADLNND